MSDDVQPVFAETIAEAAKSLGVHERTLKSWLAEGAPPKTDDGYNVDAILQWRAANRKTSDLSLEDPDEFKLRMALAKLKEQEGKADKVTEEAAIAAYKKHLLAEGLIHASSANNTFANALKNIRNRLQRIPVELAAGYAPEIQRQLERDLAQRIDIALRALRIELESGIDDD
ncbi:hypothetical protein Mal15_22080 [Stieleria maiorica]|uniref:Phage DNA packaging protein Nu1 n=1 Tax=Stieleria maiorica TaxID=2795974 RepID=A0A5B9MDX8_9BACT|nr:hypothetical protein [Stieleria maiorica]QEF98160.1 hypothetical protein Mal15_22080 [Stieleria maiorica]